MSCMGFDGLVQLRALIEGVPSPWGWVVLGVVGLLALIGLSYVVALIRDMVATLGWSP
ncbi:MAG: hypothetical protein WC343_03005 [Bacilli bacterium]